MPGFIRQKAALPHRETAPSKPTAAMKTAPAKKTTSSLDLTTPNPKPASKKRSSPDSPASPSSPSAGQNGAKKTRVIAPIKSTSPKPTTTSAPKQAPLPSSLPANGQDYLHDPSGLLPQLMGSYNVATMQIISSSKMSAKIARSLDTLGLGKIDLADRQCKPGLMVLYSKAGTASKLVSIAEVIKRDLGGKGHKYYQYSALNETMQVIPRKAEKRSRKKMVEREEGEMEVDGEEEDEASYFETMKTRQERVLEGTDRVRAVPVLTVYLSRVPIEKLKVKFGEQTNAKK